MTLLWMTPVFSLVMLLSVDPSAASGKWPRTGRTTENFVAAQAAAGGQGRWALSLPSAALEPARAGELF